MRTHILTNAKTGEVTEIPFTPEEEAECDAKHAETVKRINARKSIEDRIAAIEKHLGL